MARRKRTLSSEEQRLWEHVARHVKPLSGRGARPEPPETSVALPPVAPPTIAPPLRPGAAKPPPKPKPPKAPFLPAYHPPQSTAKPVANPPTTGLERKERVALRRRSRDVDGVIDLHGMRQAEAQVALMRFLQQSRALDRSIVLVITGKGGEGLRLGMQSGPYGLGDERGVLRRMVPHWLRAPDLRPFVVGFEEAAAHAGGSGALYVRLRRRGK
jgi:DNA-nicking Smr family endonuclease